MDWEGSGVQRGYWNAMGQWREPSSAAFKVISAAAEPANNDGFREQPHIWFVRAGNGEFLRSPCDLVLEDGTLVANIEALAPDTPPGYHELHPLDGGPTTRLVVSPGRCHAQHERSWGWAVQLYATRSKRSWGIGDLGDLAELGRLATRQGAGVLGINPLHAVGPKSPQQPSPYYPSSRRYRNPIYLQVEQVPGARELGESLTSAINAGRQLNLQRQIDRDQVWKLKSDVLSQCFEQSEGQDPAFRTYLDKQGASLKSFGTFCAIAELHGNDWRRWPAALKRGDSAAVAELSNAMVDRVRFHCWLQWQLDEQLARAGAQAPIMGDLAIGVDPGGADAWLWQDLLAIDMSVGAPPDEFNTKGQNWGLPPFIPYRLREAYYAPFIETLRAAFRHVRGVRIDHVMGLFRLFWIPPGADPGDGTYVSYPSSEMLDLVALESHRAGAFVVGEDLGTVEEEVRIQLANRSMLSYKLFWFETVPISEYPEQALAAVSTHDLPTIAGRWTGADLDAQEDLGLQPNVEGELSIRKKLADLVGCSDTASPTEVAKSAYEALGKAPSHIVVASLEDALGVVERPNMPGTIDQWPNWSLALPVELEDLGDQPGIQGVAEGLRESRPRHTHFKDHKPDSL